jgi:hypothetical protein
MECHRESLPMIAELPGKATGPSIRPPNAMTQPAIIPLYPHRVRFAGQPLVISKYREKTVPPVGRYRIVSNS